LLTTTGAIAALGLEASGLPLLRQSTEGNLTSLTLRQASDLLRKKSVTSVALTQACLARIEKYQPVLNAFITVTAEHALAQAQMMDAELKAGKWRGPLHGVPIALKDIIDTAGIRTSAASAVFADRVPTEDAEVTRRLNAASAVMLGKLNMDEFASGGTSVMTYFGPVHNPWALDRNAGGSSGGSGAAVARRKRPTIMALNDLPHSDFDG
jgi:aspartyl-tRNA(Asn)/glutamyl-tRNA(Gln) amidotransferase subunit A